MTSKDEESKIRREGFHLCKQEAKALLDLIELVNPSHDAIEPEIIIKLELIAGISRIETQQNTKSPATFTGEQKP